MTESEQEIFGKALSQLGNEAADLLQPYRADVATRLAAAMVREGVAGVKLEVRKIALQIAGDLTDRFEDIVAELSPLDDSSQTFN